MTATVVLDSSAIVALLSDAGSTGDWVATTIEDAHLAAPQLVMFESANVLRRLGGGGLLSENEALLAHGALRRLAIQLWPYEPLAGRVWDLRSNLTAYDASYVALAEMLGADLVTLDRRLARATAPRCEIFVPPLA